MARCLVPVSSGRLAEVSNVIKIVSTRLCASNEVEKLEDSVRNTRFVPESKEASEELVNKLQHFISKSRRLFILTGAGISTESGIPDYRSEGVGLYARSTNRPVLYSDFVKEAKLRQRYWARNFVGWPTFSVRQPNTSHNVLSEWERRGKIHWLVTQNVDALHFKSGSRRTTELHGSAHRVHCLGCDWTSSRWKMQEMIEGLNPGWHAEEVEMAPDGDVQLSTDQIAGFQVPPCPNCGGILKPQIVFFGDNVARPIVEFVHNRVKESDAFLVIGSSLEVFSGYRFVHAADSQGKPVAILNIGPTRGDKFSNLRLHSRCGDVLRRIKLL
ncbi:hypothetical protein ScPMuIL_006155 [Solemya velum]